MWYSAVRAAKAAKRTHGRDSVKTGIVRRVDELGRIVLPAALRRTMDIGEKDLMEISVEGDRVILRKYRPTCAFCDCAGVHAVFRGKNICRACLQELRELTGEDKP